MAPTESTTTVAPTTTSPPQVLSTPEPPPSPSEDYPIVVMGTIEIPAIDMKQNIVRGVALRSFDHGVGWWPGTALPGGYGNVVFGGHRTTRPRPFRHLDKLKPGDTIILATSSKKFTYVVRKIEIVDNSALWIIDQKPGYQLTLFACHPVGSTSQRIVVVADLKKV